MVKIRTMWPTEHAQNRSGYADLVEAVKAVRKSVVASDGLFDLAALREVQRRASKLGTRNMEFSVIEGDEVRRLAKVWRTWLKFATSSGASLEVQYHPDQG